jgi:IS5 family transposase
MKTDGHLGRCYLKGAAGDAANNLRLVLAWLRTLLRLILIALGRLFAIPTLSPAS